MRQPDKLDVASEIEEAERLSVIEQHINRPKQTPTIVGGLRLCDDCGDVIPPQRIEASPDCVRCIYCETDHDKKQLHRARR
jgi:DnaK suppressor protein